MFMRPLLAIQEATRLNLPPEKLYFGQFIINGDPTPPFDGYVTRALCGRFMHFCPTLDLCEIRKADGTVIALLLGHALDENGRGLKAAHVLDMPRNTRTDRAIEAFLTGITGRYIMLASHGGSPCLYTDAVGEMGVVYDTTTGVAGSTLPMILDRKIEDRADLNHDAVLESLGHYALGYTRDIHCERLHPNHRLDLEGMHQSRFWPRDDAPWTEAANLPFDTMIEELIGILRRNTIGFLGLKPSVFPLSGGQDSRMLIAAARDYVHQASAVFGMEHNKASQQDCAVGAEVAGRLGLDYWRIKAPGLRRWGHRAFHARVGYLANSGGTGSVRHTQRLPEGHLVIRGNVFGLTRANDWGRARRAKAWDDVPFGMHRLKMGAAISQTLRPADLEARYLAWRDSLPGAVRERCHDLSFCENYLPNSLGARNYAYTNVFHVNPFASRRAITLVSAVDPQLRKENRINQAMLAATAADLADIDFV